MINDQKRKNVGRFFISVSMSASESWIQNQTANDNVLRCIIERDKEGIGLGTVVLSDIDQKNGTAQIHIKLGVENCRGKGFGTEAVNTITEYAFSEMRLNCIYAEVLEYNTASQKLFEKCGFQRDGLLRERVFKGGKYINIVAFSRLKEDKK